MANSSKQAMSGLRTIKRDWSSSSQQSTEEPEFWPTPPSASEKPLTPREQRMKDIQDALSGKTTFSEQQTAQAMSSIQNANNKRSIPGLPQPPAKKRQLPPTWKEDPLSKATNFITTGTSSSSGAREIPSVTVTALSKSKSASKPAAVFLSAEQKHILKLVEEGHSVFYTGSAGTGKSVLLREIIKTMQQRYSRSPDAVAITASTGIAACNIGGVTIHSFSGIGLGVGSADDLVVKVRKNKKAMTRWLRTKVLIIDEVSMVDGDLFDKLAKIGCMIKKSVEPFGGTQVIVTGDFFQLPPVMKGEGQVKFAFEAQYWGQTIKRTFNLTKVFRQKDQDFVDMLNEMRFGKLSFASVRTFKSLSRQLTYDDGLTATELFPRREDVERSNRTRISQLVGEGKKYEATDSGTVDPAQREKMLANFMAPKTLELRVGAQVMLIKNVDETLVNGSIGKVIAFADPAFYGTNMASDVKKPAKVGQAAMDMPVVAFSVPNRDAREMIITPEVWKVELPSGEIQVARTQLPLILSWAMSIHKSQGQTLERVKVDLGRVFEKGQAYVALSRATSLKGLQVLNFDPMKVRAHPTVVEWSRTLEILTSESDKTE